MAYLSLTRVDVVIFIAALQRFNHTPKVVHAKRLNVAVRWVQRNAVKFVYSHFDKADNIVLGVSDAAFKKEEDEATAMRGCVVIRADASLFGTLDGDVLRSSRCHVLEYASKKQRHVTRSTFAVELFGCCDTIDIMLVVIFEVDGNRDDGSGSTTSRVWSLPLRDYNLCGRCVGFQCDCIPVREGSIRTVSDQPCTVAPRALGPQGH